MLLESLSPHCSVWGGRVQHNFPARADFVWIGHIVVSSCRPLGINNLCRFSFLLIDVSLHRGETGAGAPPASYMLGMPTTEDKATEASGKQRKTPKSKNVIVGLSVTSSLYIGTESPPGARWPQGAPHPQPCDPHTAV